ncbi:EAL domain-containing protein [Paraburkholderia sp. J10-1]|uniref:EAL domain-containing protein n=1 Tax=Paraburkholderia sp. J10-1 TaxID=2805430 RepID=UPI002AB7A46D|nr:EAL domain-containing protein [Paraburkholderia sp. J10-1]
MLCQCRRPHNRLCGCPPRLRDRAAACTCGLVQAILSIAPCLGQRVVAEGVETIEQAAFLDAHGCEVAEGFLYSKPLPKREIASFPAISVRALRTTHNRKGERDAPASPTRCSHGSKLVLNASPVPDRSTAIR